MQNKKLNFRFQDYVFVLWGNQFQEVAAAVFVGELRCAGLPVKLVSLSRKSITGLYGLTLLPDLTLEQALPMASQAIAIIIPSGSQGAKQLENDPRLTGFFKEAHANNAEFVIDRALADTSLFAPSISNAVCIYPENEELVCFARQLSKFLSNRTIDYNGDKLQS